MRLFLRGHGYKYAAEQLMLMMFPTERPEYPEGAPKNETDAALLTLSEGAVWTTATAKVWYGGKTACGTARVKTAEKRGKTVTDRLEQKIIKLAFFKAASEVTGNTPEWGALTGIRPGKIATGLIESGKTEKQAERYLIKDCFVSPVRAGLCTDTARAGLRAKRSLGEKDIALYIGVPFCPTRCAYCSFVSIGVEKSHKLSPQFTDVLLGEIDAAAETARSLGLSVISVYMGGGTPTTLSAEQLNRVLSHASDAFGFERVRDYTVEAGRPDTITDDKLAALRQLGVKRISINPQSMDDAVLRAIGRRHSAEDVRRAFYMAREHGFDEINTDVIAGLPGDTPEGFERTLRELTDMSPENITVHTLSLKKGTRITLEDTARPDGDAVGRMVDFSLGHLRKSGYSPYYLYRQKFMSGGFENIGWARPGHENLYNILIMEELCTILALGGGGSTKLVAPRTGRIERIFNAKYPQEYIASAEKMAERKHEIAEFYERWVF